MRHTTRLLLAAAATVVLFAACSGGGNSEDDVRRDVTAMFDAVFGDELNIAEFAKYFPRECPQDVGELALGFAFLQAFLGDADIEFEVANVELQSDDRALVSVTGSGAFLDTFADGAEAEDDLWVLQDDRWRSTSDCDAFDEERAALGLDTTPDTGDEVSSGFDGFGNDFGPPVAASLGQPLEVGGLIVTVRGASLSSDPADSFSEPPQGVFVVVDFTFANEGQEPTSPFWALKLDLFDDRGRTWEAADIPFEDVGPGFSQDFQARWDVPLEATGFRLVVSADQFADLALPDDFAPWEVPLGSVQ
jgi:hypothetical protein